MKKFFFATSILLSSLTFAVKTNLEMLNYATEGLANINGAIAASSMKNGAIKLSNGNHINLAYYLEDWNEDHRIMGMSYDSKTDNIIFVSPNYRGGALLSVNLRTYESDQKTCLKLNVVKVHVTEAGLLNDVKLTDHHIIATNSNPFMGRIYKFSKTETLKDNSARELTENDILNDELDFVNGVHLEKDVLFVAATTDKAIYKVDLETGKHELFSDIGEGWPDDVISMGSKMLVSDNQNGGLFVLDKNGKVEAKISLKNDYGKNITPANLVRINGRVYFSDLWNASTLRIIATEISPMDFNEYQHGVYSISVIDIINEVNKQSKNVR